MNLYQLFTILVPVIIVAVIVLRARKSGWSGHSTTNLLLAGMGLVGFYLYTESENRAAIRTGDWDRCWSIFAGSSCHSQMAANAADRLSGGTDESLTTLDVVNADQDFAESLNEASTSD